MILGGHSAGASTAVAYAAWDFGGRPGYRELDGLVLIDGGLLGSFDEANAARARRELAEIRGGNVFLDLLGLGIPEIAGIFAQVGALYAYERPDAPVRAPGRSRCCRPSSSRRSRSRTRRCSATRSTRPRRPRASS